MLSNLLTEDQLLDESFSFSPLGFPSNGDSPASLLLSETKSDVTNQSDPLSIVLNVPSAFGIKTTQDKVTYINKGEEGERGRVREREGGGREGERGGEREGERGGGGGGRGREGGVLHAVKNAWNESKVHIHVYTLHVYRSLV